MWVVGHCAPYAWQDNDRPCISGTLHLHVAFTKVTTPSGSVVARDVGGSDHAMHEQRVEGVEVQFHISNPKGKRT